MTCYGRAHSREARLRVGVSEWHSATEAVRQTVVAALFVLVFHLVLWYGLQCDDEGKVMIVGKKVWIFWQLWQG